MTADLDALSRFRQQHEAQFYPSVMAGLFPSPGEDQLRTDSGDQPDRRLNEGNSPSGASRSGRLFAAGSENENDADFGASTNFSGRTLADEEAQTSTNFSEALSFTSDRKPMTSIRLRLAQFSVVALTVLYTLVLVALTIYLEGREYSFLLLPLLVSLFLAVWLWRKLHKKGRNASDVPTMDPVEYHDHRHHQVSLVTSLSFGCLYFTLMLCSPLLLRQAYQDLGEIAEEGKNLTRNSSEMSESDHMFNVSSTFVLSLLKSNLAIFFIGLISREEFRSVAILANRDLITRAVLDNLDIFSLAKLLDAKCERNHSIAPRGSPLEIAILITTSLSFIVPYIFTADIFQKNSALPGNRNKLSSLRHAEGTSHRMNSKTRLLRNSRSQVVLNNIRLPGIAIANCFAQRKAERRSSQAQEVPDGRKPEDDHWYNERLLAVMAPAAFYVYSLVFANLPFIVIRVYVWVSVRETQVEFVLKDLIGVFMAVLNIRNCWTKYKQGFPATNQACEICSV